MMRQRDDMESACRNTVASAMRELGLKSRVFKMFKPTMTQVDPSKRPAQIVLEQNLPPQKNLWASGGSGSLPS